MNICEKSPNSIRILQKSLYFNYILFWIIHIEFLVFLKNKSKNFKKYVFEKKIHLEKNISEFFWAPMSMRNFPNIPKIALRKPTDHPKYSTNQKIRIYCTKRHISTSRELSFGHPLYSGIDPKKSRLRRSESMYFPLLHAG